MLTLALLTPWRLLLVAVAGIAAGISNGIAGGGTFITFPTLLAVGIPALTANVSSSVGVLPSYIGGLRGFRKEIATHRRLLWQTVPWCVAGTVVGCGLLLRGSNHTFRVIVPWLIGAGTILFALSPLVTRRLAQVSHQHPARRRTLSLGLFLIAVYGGYFGAGLGILLLAVMAVALPLGINELQGVRSVLSTLINGVAATVFIIRGHLAWEVIVVLLLGTLTGGMVGTALIRRLSPNVVRALVIATGVASTIRLATTG